MHARTPAADAAIRMLELQRDVAATLAAIRDHEEGSRAILAACLKVDGVDSGGVYLLDERTHALHLAAHAGLGAGFVARVSYYPPDAPQLRLVSDHVVFATPYRDLAPPLDDVRRAEGLRGLAVVALRCDGDLVGAINVASHEHEHLSEASVAAIAAIAAVSGATLRRLTLERAVRDREQRYRSLFETMAQGVVYQEADGSISEANPAAERILGLSLDQLRGRTSDDPRWRAVRDDGSPYPGDQHPAMVALRTGQPVRETVMGIDNPAEHARRWLLLSATPVFRDGAERPHRVFATFEDITDRKQAEDTLKRTRDRLQRLTDHLQSVAEEERKAVAREIHDELGQALTAMKLDVARLSKHVAGCDDEVGVQLGELSKGLDRLLDTVRNLARRLRPAILDDLGLVPALRWLLDDFEQRSAVRVSARLPAESPTVDDRVALAVFRFVQEALTNIARHAGATRVELRLRVTRATLAVIVRDNGCGLPRGGVATGSYGIMGMLERVNSLGGTFSAGDARGGGTELRVELPRSPRSP